jgi:hypothetical protein
MSKLIAAGDTQVQPLDKVNLKGIICVSLLEAATDNQISIGT